jgi:hypothetical protein
VSHPDRWAWHPKGTGRKEKDNGARQCRGGGRDARDVHPPRAGFWTGQRRALRVRAMAASPPEQGSAMDADLHIRGTEPVLGQNVIPLG